MFKLKKGNLNPNNIMLLVIAVVFAAAAIPTAVISIGEAAGNFTGGALTLWNLLPFIIVAVIAFAVLGYLKMKKR